MMAAINALFIMYGIGAVLAVIGLVILSFGGESSGTPPQNIQPDIKVDVHVDVPQQTQYPSLAEQFDGRLTNIVRNPLEGIL